MIQYINMAIKEQKNIALIAHDGKKQEMLKWCEKNKSILKQHKLCGTGTTARMITNQVGLQVKGYNSGPLGGDQQIGAKIVEDRIAQVYDIPIANNISTADFIIHSSLMNEEYTHQVENFANTVQDRAKEHHNIEKQ